MPNRLITFVAGSIVAILVAVWALRSHSSTPADGSTLGAAGSDVPVVVEEVRRQDMSIYLDGLGKVQALNTVTVRSQVDGKIMQIEFREGQDVKAGDLLVQIDPRPYQAALDQVVAKGEQDQAQLLYAQKVLERNESLSKQGMLDQQSLDLQRATVAQQTALARADEAAANNARIQLEFTRITAPISGRVGLRLVDQGNLVHANDTNGLVVITQVEPISVVFTLPENNFEQVHGSMLSNTNNQPLTVVALDRANHRIVGEGSLAAVDNQIDEGNGTIKFKATFKNEGQTLWPGQFVNVKLRVAQEKNALVVPTGAIQQGPNGDCAYLIGGVSATSIKSVSVIRRDECLAFFGNGLSGC